MPKQEVIFLRTSERSSFKRCRQAWWWAFVEQVKPKTAAPALRFGSLVHKAMEIRYPKGVKRGPHPAETFERLYEEELKTQTKMGFRDEDGDWHEAGQMGVAMLNHFVEEFGKDEEWEVVASELPFQVTLHETERFKVVYVGVIDGVWRNRKTKKLWMNDWKTAKTISTKHLTLDEQAGAYWGFGPDFLLQEKLIKKTDALQGILFTFMRKAKPDGRYRHPQSGLYLNLPKAADVKHVLNENGLYVPKKGEGSGKDGAVVVADLVGALPDNLRDRALILGEVSKDQPGAFFERVPTRRSKVESERLKARALSEAQDMMRVRLGKSDVYINPSAMNCGSCGYRDPCELQESGHDFESLMKMTMVDWDPYAEHEVYDRS